MATLQYIPTTELEAINAMLAAITVAPVNTVSAGSVDVATARNTLHNVSRQVQSMGWHFNTEKAFPLAANVDGTVEVPADTLRVETENESAYLDLVQRGNRLYDRRNHTYAIGKTVKVDLVLFLPFESLPQAARAHIATEAGRLFADGRVGSESVDSFTRSDAAKTLAILKKAEGKTARHNIINGTRSSLQATGWPYRR